MDFGILLVGQLMTGAKFVATADNDTPQVSFNGITLSSDQTGAIGIENVQPAPDAPAGSAFTCDLRALAPSVGVVTLNAKGQQGNAQPVFNSQFTITVNAPPPTPPTHWVGTPGTIS